jgi:ATP-dependent Clp protease, protease subunit
VSTPHSTWPPRPPEPPWRPDIPEPPGPPRTPWLPTPAPPAPGPVSASASLVLGATDWLAQRLLEQRMVALAGELDAATVNRTVAELALLDASGDEPVELRLSGLAADLDLALTLVDALDLMGAPVHATALGTVTGAAVAVLAVADRRTAGPHLLVQLREPRSPRGVPGVGVAAVAAEHARQLRRLEERLAEACGRPVDAVAADLRAGRLLDAAEAREYGLVDAGPSPSRR